MKEGDRVPQGEEKPSYGWVLRWKCLSRFTYGLSRDNSYLPNST